MSAQTKGHTEVYSDRPLLEVRNLKTFFNTDDGVVRAINGVSLDVKREKVLGVVGESGCGKSMTALSILQLVPKPGRIEEGSITYYGHGSTPVDIAPLKPEGREMMAIRGNEIAMVFQEPMTSLSPVYTVGSQIVEAVRLHRSVSKRDAQDFAGEMLRKVGIPDPKQRLDEYPFQMSGGMRQRVLIAMALSCGPKLLIADEPTTALDVTVQAQILRLMRSLQEEASMAIMMITHDLGVIARIADEVVVMYLGKVVERAPVRDLFKRPQHPYTEGLLRSTPHMGVRQKLISIEGSVPGLHEISEGCGFRDRCPFAMEKCKEEPPEFDLGDGRASKCWLNDGRVERVEIPDTP